MSNSVPGSENSTYARRQGQSGEYVPSSFRPSYDHEFRPPSSANSSNARATLRTDYDQAGLRRNHNSDGFDNLGFRDRAPRDNLGVTQSSSVNSLHEQSFDPYRQVSERPLYTSRYPVTDRSTALEYRQPTPNIDYVSSNQHTVPGNKRQHVIDINITIGPSSRVSQTSAGTNNSGLITPFRSSTKFENVHVVDLDFRAPDGTALISTDGFQRV